MFDYKTALLELSEDVQKVLEEFEALDRRRVRRKAKELVNEAIEKRLKYAQLDRTRADRLLEKYAGILSPAGINALRTHITQRTARFQQDVINAYAESRDPAIAVSFALAQKRFDRAAVVKAAGLAKSKRFRKPE